MYDALMYAHYKSGSREPIEKIHKRLLTENIYAFDASKISCVISILILALKYKEFILCENIVCRDVFEEAKKGALLFDWVVCDFSVNNDLDKPAYYKLRYADHLLKKDGKLICMFEQGVLHRQEEKELRKKILDEFSVLKVIDITDNDLLKNPQPLPVIFYLNKCLKYEHLFEVMQLSLNGREELPISVSDMRSFMALQDELDENEFDFYDQSQSKLIRRITALCPHTLEEAVHLFQGIISGCDKAFFVHDNSLVYSQCIGECGVPWIKGKDITDRINFYGQYLLYTNNAEGIDNFPLTKKRLEMYKSLLLKRRECIKGVRQWYELQWGREKELFLKEKILFAAKSKKNRFIYDDQGYFFSADIYGAAALDSVQIDLKKLSLLLNSDIYEWYMKSIMKKINRGMYAYYPDTLRKIRIPPLDVIASFNNEEDINHYFGFNIIGEKNEND